MPRGIEKSAKRNEPVLESLILMLRRKLPGFKAELPEVQASLASLIWSYGTKRRQHKGKEGSMSIPYQEIARRFGRSGFNAINNRLGIFDVSRGWSTSRNLTKHYTLKPDVLAIKDAYLHQGRTRLTSLVSENGLRIKTLPKAVASKGMDGITAKAWAKAAITNNVPVSLVMLDALKGYLNALLKPHTLNLFGNLDSDSVAYSRDMVAKILRLAKVDVSGEGHVMHRYVEAPSGRLYAVGINLQTVPTLIKQAALHGLYEYDIENCHYSIFQQMAARVGFTCPAITNYLARKANTRKTIAKDVDITVDQAKVCLLAIMYGAGQSEWHEAAIPGAIGKKAKLLYQHPLFAGIYADIEQGRRAIIAGCLVNTKHTILNAMGKGIKVDTDDKFILAHLIQGVESQLLRAALDLYPQEIVLLQHDGFASTKRLEKARLEKAMQATGYRMEVSEECIQMPADFGASRH